MKKQDVKRIIYLLESSEDRGREHTAELARIATAVEAVNTRDEIVYRQIDEAHAEHNTDIQDDAVTRMHDAMQKPGAKSAPVIPMHEGDGFTRSTEDGQANVWVDVATGEAWVKKPDYDQLRRMYDSMRENRDQFMESCKEQELELEKLTRTHYAEAVERLDGWRKRALEAEGSKFQDPAPKQEGARILLGGREVEQ